MRTFINVTHISLDGVMDRMEDWHFDYVDADDVEAYTWGTLAPCDTLVIGRRSYESFAAVWPAQSGRIADRLNSMRKLLVSTTVTEPEWNNTDVVAGDLTEILTALKGEDGGSVMTYGFGPVVAAMVSTGLLDELHLGINPTLAGKGDLAEMLIREDATGKFDLIEATPLSTGLVMLSYRPRS